MTDHYVRHLLSQGYLVRTEFVCRAPEGAQCRSWCDTCSHEQRDRCECSGLGREPHLVSHEECNLVLFLHEEPEYSYGGDDTAVRGPDWQPIQIDWTAGDESYEWSYAEPLAKAQQGCGCSELWNSGGGLCPVHGKVQA